MNEELIATEQRLKEANDYIEKLETALLQITGEAASINVIAVTALGQDDPDDL